MQTPIFCGPYWIPDFQQSLFNSFCIQKRAQLKELRGSPQGACLFDSVSLVEFFVSSWLRSRPRKSFIIFLLGCAKDSHALRAKKVLRVQGPPRIRPSVRPRERLRGSVGSAAGGGGSRKSLRECAGVRGPTFSPGNSAH